MERLPPMTKIATALGSAICPGLGTGIGKILMGNGGDYIDFGGK